MLNNGTFFVFIYYSFEIVNNMDKNLIIINPCLWSVLRILYEFIFSDDLAALFAPQIWLLWV